MNSKNGQPNKTAQTDEFTVRGFRKLVASPFSRQTVNAPFTNTARLFISLSHYVLILYFINTFKENNNHYGHSTN